MNLNFLKKLIKFKSTIILWDLWNNNQIIQKLTDYNDHVLSLAFSPNG